MFFYHLIVSPIEYLIEAVFTLMSRFLNNDGYAIIAVSLVISTLVLPLYLRGDAIQEEERKKQAGMDTWLKHIRKHFSGDERYLMINTYYREQGYRPLYTLRGILPLLLQIPFFIAAYHFLSHLQRLQECSFYFISDLGKEDMLIPFGPYHLNALPILMTAFNLLSTVIYTKGLPWKTKIQPVLLAGAFLILLYHSPSGLVLYWTMNNLYSLIKNLIMKYIKKPVHFFNALLAGCAVLFCFFLLISGRIKEKLAVNDREALFIYIVVMILLCFPLLSGLLRKFQRPGSDRLNTANPRFLTAVLLELCFVILWGFVIPFLVIAVSPQDFLEFDRSVSPIRYATETAIVSSGVFLVWGSVIYLLSDNKRKALYEELLFLLLATSILNVMAFCAKIGNVSTMLEFDALPHFDLKTKGLNLLLIVVILLVGHLLWKISDHGSLLRLRNGIIIVTFLSLSSMAIKDVVTVDKNVHDLVGSSDGQIDYVIPLSKNGKNVVLIMLDRAISGFVPYIFDEKPQLKDSFEGFVYYPNTLSYGTSTQTGAPGLYGGYDYSTKNAQEREKEVPLPDQHDEALLTMPILFGEAGWKVTVTDPPIVHWEGVTDWDMFRQYPYINAFQLHGTLPTGYSMEEMYASRCRNFFFYSIYRCAPAMLQDELYDTGGYLAADRDYFLGEYGFRYGYTALKNLGTLTQITDDNTNYFIDMCNNTTHGGAMLSLPDYEVDKIPDYTGIDVAADKTVNGMVLHFDQNNRDFSVGHYHSNMKAYLLLADWFEQLKEWGVYDNTRIILVSDHGFWLENFDYLNYPIGIDVETMNALLMVKDFNSREPFATDDQFMCNADTPTLAMEGLIEDPHNPFTGNPINMDGKEGGLDIFWPGGIRYQATPKYDSASEPKWFHVQDSIFDENNWVIIP